MYSSREADLNHRPRGIWFVITNYSPRSTVIMYVLVWAGLSFNWQLAGQFP